MDVKLARVVTVVALWELGLAGSFDEHGVQSI